MSRAEHTLGSELAQAVKEEKLGWQRIGPLMTGLLMFGLDGLWMREYAFWPLALGLWLGYAATDGLCGLLGRRAHPGQRATLAGLLLALLLGAALGWAIEQALVVQAMTAAERITRAGLHLSFGTLMLGLPLLQGLRRLRALRRVEQERARLRAELQMLQAQIEPHFLFNTLATLRSFVRQGSDRALPLLDAVSGFLDTALARIRQTESTLGAECQIVEHYLAIMGLRLGERLSWHIDVDDRLRELPLPPLMLQPLIENALVHGIEPSESGGHVLLQASLQDARLQLRVVNSGHPLSAGLPAGHGLALANLRQRLLALYGDRAELRLTTTADHLTEARLSLPLP